MKTKIAIACDDVGFDRKEEIKKYLEEEKNADVVYDPVKRKKTVSTTSLVWRMKWQVLFSGMNAASVSTSVEPELALLAR